MTVVIFLPFKPFLLIIRKLISKIIMIQNRIIHVLCFSVMVPLLKESDPIIRGVSVKRVLMMFLSGLLTDPLLVLTLLSLKALRVSYIVLSLIMALSNF